jgi:hypothetical protein
MYITADKNNAAEPQTPLHHKIAFQRVPKVKEL